MRITNISQAGFTSRSLELGAADEATTLLAATY